MKLPVLNNTIATSEAGGCASGSCGSSDASVQNLPESIRAKVADHPCFSEQAHHFFARMHVAVAPACNIQCNYCNRKYDCSNESRPGVVSEVLTPQQAVKKVKAVAAAIPQMSVLGIAGPGDPLANPQKTFETFRRLSAETPDIKLCVSTNGLTLPECVDELCQHNIDHVTVTINCVDPEIGAKIYPWIFWKNKRIRGVEAASILIEQQQKGLQMLIDRGILVKVNSVLIPGINDQHLIEVSRIVKEKGAFLHNVMPIISEPEHGTYFGLTGQAEPTAAELQAVQDACAGDMNMMRHCRQCRADAVGLLGEDRGAEFTLDKIEAMDIDYEAAMVKRAEVHDQLLEQLYAQRESASKPVIRVQGRAVLMAVATKGGGVINQHFGHATEFLVYEASRDGVRFIGHRQVAKPYCEGNSNCGDEAENLLDTLLKALQGCEVLLCSKVGYEPWSALEQAGIQPNGEHAMEPIEDAILAVYQEMLTKGLLQLPDAVDLKSA
ncbi:nitrogenase cofactor biosynthesis protein NifB [Nitrincola alkalisediminis]|uniref:nitrogenase cofactor biosynthesis protein NifB n=1 Tax=Nitrincola alkalisediminis TaxID=1366656 RepID=UPI0018753E85|nr:nitrogenase cofactor biosynthesis protein NifB [Nitrincola alkalisediminis]